MAEIVKYELRTDTTDTDTIMLCANAATKWAWL